MASDKPVVSIIMGSESDLDAMRPSWQVLADLGIDYEVRIASAHRTPDVVSEYAEGAADRGVKVIIAGAGAAAALPGVVAAHTALPVIGVPIDATPLRGVDALYAIVQMPSGIPVATMPINGAKNAGVMAARILALGCEELTVGLQQMSDANRGKIIEADQRVQGSE